MDQSPGRRDHVGAVALTRGGPHNLDRGVLSKDEQLFLIFCHRQRSVSWSAAVRRYQTHALLRDAQETAGASGAILACSTSVAAMTAHERGAHEGTIALRPLLFS